MDRKNAFTLSEVLITLVVIGVIAAITVPSLMNNTNSEEYRASLKKAISGLNQALTLEYSLNGLTAKDYSTAEALVGEVFSKRMNIVKSEDDFTSNVCSKEKDGVVFQTTDGMVFCVKNFNSNELNNEPNVCDFSNIYPCVYTDAANIYIDVNGGRKPNKLTTSYTKPKDIYQAQIYSQKVLPYDEHTERVLAGYSSDSLESEDTETPTPPEQSEPSEQPDIPNFDTDGDTPDENNPYYDQWDPNKWDSWQDFLKWLINWIINQFT